MAAARYWRVVGISTQANGVLELSEIQLYAAGVRVGAAITPSCPFTPLTGSLADLNDGVATGVVSWAYGAYSSPGFSLMWDLTGSGADVDRLRLGAGNSKATYPQDFVLQRSDDAVFWSMHSAVVDLTYPGALMLTTAPTGASNGNYDSVSLLLYMNGTDLSTVFADNSPIPKSVTAVGAKISTAQSKFGGSSAVFNGSSYLQMPNDASFALGAVCTIEAFVYPTAFTRSVAQIVGAHRYGVDNQFLVYLDASGRPHFLVGVGADVAFTSVIPLHTWTHIAICLDAGTLRTFLNGVLDKTVSYSTAIGAFAYDVTCGADITANTNSFFAGYIDEVRITKGVARYSAGFTPLTSPFPNAQIVPQDRPSPYRLRSTPTPLERILPAGELTVTTAQGHLREYPFFDAYNGGLGIVLGTVKEQNSPANTPLRRRVLLVDEASRMTIRETWSDAITGNYEFRGVKQGVKYTVLSYDHWHNYRAVVADNLEAA